MLELITDTLAEIAKYARPRRVLLFGYRRMVLGVRPIATRVDVAVKTAGLATPSSWNTA